MSIHVTTFYSFKGGVGRTQALVNCAAWIASNQRPEAGQRPRVLMIDFDLEASGIQFVEGLTVVDPKPGVVDFIHDYLDHAGEVPDISKYISQAILPNGVQVDVILAGDQARYYRRFGQLRFDALWQHQHGSALFLDMKNQLDELGYEFMLVDSRTGLCDTSELCTLTLPDQVVVVFAPNRQNLAGTRLVIERVRQNPLVDVIGVASRIRKTDDEHGGLRSILTDFKQVFAPNTDLSFLSGMKSKPWLVVHEDPQQRLLSDAIAVVSYPRSGLAKDYRRIARRIVARNPRSCHWISVICADAPTRERMARRPGPSGPGSG
jgi:MinD-like ATPase involved in chromosome partitioning or flagellar assembly